MNYAKTGKPLTDEMLVDLLAKRLAMNDCQKKGWILDGFPTNKNQCNLLNKHGLLPINVFTMKLTEIEIKKRVLAKNKNASISEYNYDMDVIDERLSKNRHNLHEVAVYFATRYNNLKMLEGKVSQWGLFESAKK